MFEGLLILFVMVGIGIFADDVVLWPRRCCHWSLDAHRADRATYETTTAARRACHPHREGREQTKIQALRKLEAAVTPGDAKQRVR
jgi:hypothetical protein